MTRGFRLLFACHLLTLALAKEPFRFPVIDVQPWTTRTTTATANDALAQRQEEVAKLVKQACEEIGFFAIQNHGVNATVMDALWRSAAEFFDLPLDQKLHSKTKNETEYPYGYEQSETLVAGKSLDNNDDKDPALQAAAPPDLKETFAIGPYNPQAGMPPRKYPPQPAAMQEALDLYYREMEGLATTLLRIFATALQLPEHWFDDKMDQHLSALRLVNYWQTSSDAVAEGRLRAGAHTDYGALTILKSGGPGLQVLRAHDNEWVHVPTIPDAFVVNLGDLMQRWTNDQWVSTLHRVVVLDQPQNERRQSIAYFVNVNGDTPVDTLETCIGEEHPKKYPTILAKDHLMAKHLASMGVTAEENQGSRDEL